MSPHSHDRTSTPPLIAVPRAPDGASDDGRLAFRVGAPIDADALGEELSALWRDAWGPRRATPRVELSVVETCGRTADERERDALRLLQSERRAARTSAALRATLVVLGTGTCLLLLAASPGAGGEDALQALAGALAQHYPVASIAA